MISVFRKKNLVDDSCNELSIEDLSFVTKYNNQFCGDKIRIKNEKYILVLDGIILNKGTIEKNANVEGWDNCVISLYEEKGELFFSALRGMFVGAIYDITKKKCIVFHDQLGSVQLYYAVTDGLFISSEISFLYEELKRNAIKLHLDTRGVRMVLETIFGMTIDNYTICEEVRKLMPGSYLVYENGKLIEKQFYSIQRKEIDLQSEDEYLDLIEEKYQAAIKRQFGKDDEYGYKIVTCLSGGIDSRMMVWIAHQLGWTKQLNVTSSNSGWYDETVARQIAKDLHHEWLFKPMDDAQFMYTVDEGTRLTGGCRAYYGVMHMHPLLSVINHEGAKLGMMHTGSQGEILKGESVEGGQINNKGNFYLNYLNSIGVNSNYDYSDPEVCTIVNKYLQVDQGPNSMSPLLDLDFFEMTLSIPARLRKDEYIYKQWVTKRHQDANKYVWATTGVPYGSRRFNPQLPIIHVYLHHLPKYIKYKMGYGCFLMNPFHAFYKSDPGIKILYDTYIPYVDAIEDIDLRRRVLENFNSSDVTKKMKAVTVLSAIKLYFT